MIDRMFEILNTLTEEAQNAATKKCNEFGFDVNRGVISLTESFINLNIAKSLLVDAIEKEKLIQLPITIQKNLLKFLESISKSLTGMTGGADEVDNIVNAIEQLNTAIWQYGLHNLSDEVLGYQTKLNQLKNIDLEAKRLKDELQDGLNIKTDLEKLLSEVNTTTETLQQTLNNSEETAKKISENLSRTTEADQQVAAKLATVQQNEDAATKHLATTKSSSAETTALETKIKEFYSEVDQYRNKITTTTENANKTVKENKASTDELISTLQKLEDQIKKQLEKATGYSLFHSFQTRKRTLVISKWIWAGLIGILLVALGYWAYWLSTYWLNTNTASFDTAFYLRLTISIPLFYAIGFCTSQYSHERKLEEEYAFKSNISVSLVPYKDLVEKIVNSDKPEEKEKYTSFIIDSINKVFTSPVDKVFEHKEKQKGLSDKALKQVLSILEPFTKIQK